jgi:hypothetical protein
MRKQDWKAPQRKIVRQHQTIQMGIEIQREDFGGSRIGARFSPFGSNSSSRKPRNQSEPGRARRQLTAPSWHSPNPTEKEVGLEEPSPWIPRRRIPKRRIGTQNRDQWLTQNKTRTDERVESQNGGFRSTAPRMVHLRLPIGRNLTETEDWHRKQIHAAIQRQKGAISDGRFPLSLSRMVHVLRGSSMQKTDS